MNQLFCVLDIATAVLGQNFKPLCASAAVLYRPDCHTYRASASPSVLLRKIICVAGFEPAGTALFRGCRSDGFGRVSVQGTSPPPGTPLGPKEQSYVLARLLSVQLHKIWWTHRDLNPEPPACKADALPLSYAPLKYFINSASRNRTWLGTT